MILAQLLLGSLLYQGIETPVFKTAQFKVEGQNLSSEFETLMYGPPAENPKPTDEISQYQFVFVTGFLSDELKKLKGVPAFGHEFGDYFADQIAWLKANQIDAQMPTINSEQTPEFNAPLIRDAIMASSKPTILISHSKGGVDTLQALLTYPELSNRVRAWIAYHAPFQGTPVADYTLEKSGLRFVAAKALQMLGGSIGSVVSLTLQTRSNHLKTHQTPIQSILKKIPTLCFSGFIRNEPGRIDTAYEIQRDLLERYGFRNDGIIPWQSEILPGSRYIIFDGVDHTAAVNRSLFIPLDRLHIFQNLLRLALR